MDLASLANDYLARFKARYGATATPDQWSALNAILGCRTEQYGELALSCSACAWHSTQHRSCGHRSCKSLSATRCKPMAGTARAQAAAGSVLYGDLHLTV